MMPGPGASVEALAAMMCTAAHGDVGAGTAPTEIAEAITTNAVNAAENILRLVSCRLFLRPLYTPTPDYFNLWGNEVFFFAHGYGTLLWSVVAHLSGYEWKTVGYTREGRF